MDAASVTLLTSVDDLPGITPRVAGLLRSLGVTNLGRLVAYLPSRHERVEAESPIGDLVADSNVSARGEITATRPVRGRTPRFEAVVVDETGRLDLVWFNGLFMAERLHPGLRVRVQGRTRRRGPGLQIANPKVEVLRSDGEEPEAMGEHVRPVYPATEQVNSATISRAIRKVLPLALPLIEDHLSEAYRQARQLPSLSDAYRMQHAPTDEQEAVASRRRLAYDELLLLQLGVHLRRAQRRAQLKAPALRFSPGIDSHVRAQLPFQLTPGQDEAVREIGADVSRETPSNRLIQGDVGSGKTAVALHAMLLAVLAGHQASLMAPTELLAEQHAAGIGRMLSGSRVKVALLTGGMAQGERDSLLARVASGEVDILVGTHALLTEDVRFKSLALAVIDEQHRFGVHQRAKLRAAGNDANTTPHVLVMTATPIPRTLAITLFGDLDISVIRGLPPGRQPIQTRVWSAADRAEVYTELARRLAAGEQAYIVVPAVEPGETADGGQLRDVRSTLAELESGPLAGHRLAGLHGRLSRDTREAVMERFRQGAIRAVVATTVIEVGVDVPNATVMVVEQADRFGLAQLHQLRGRVGRGDKASMCQLIADATTPEAEMRLRVMETVTDGFVLAEKDLEIRGPGEMFGTKQSGLPPFKVADLMRDRELLGMAKRDAAAWIEAAPTLARPADALVRRRLMKTYGPALGLGDVG